MFTSFFTPVLIHSFIHIQVFSAFKLVLCSVLKQNVLNDIACTLDELDLSFAGEMKVKYGYVSFP
jgi:hypothetical protein